MFRQTLPAFALAAGLAFGSLGSADAQSSISSDVAEKVTEGQEDRYSLVLADGDILRVDRQNGTVSVCVRKNASWRCNPVPLAEDAYLAEINSLAAEVDRLSARLKQLESGDDPVSSAPAPAPAEPDEPELAEKGEPDEELDKALDFTEHAMRRLFGMVRQLQKELEGGEDSEK